MRIVPVLSWKIEGPVEEPLDERLLPLLAAIAKHASLAAAVTRCGGSYRAAWGVLREYQERVGEPLVRLERGRGASLTPAGERLVAAHDAVIRQLAPQLPALAIEVGAGAKPVTEQPAMRLEVAASHDLVLAAMLTSQPSRIPGLQLATSFTGSLNALREFAEGRAEVAGFHIPVSGRLRWEAAPFMRWLRARRHRLLRFVDREQGLILPRGNPGGIRTLRDIAERGLRFVNRQHGSATRLLIDQLIFDSRLDPRTLQGYSREEYTHPAVAATVASGGADAGFGLRAAAAEFELAFVPLVRERYFLAFLAREAGSNAIRMLTSYLQGPAFAELVSTFPGYEANGAGDIVTVDALSEI